MTELVFHHDGWTVVTSAWTVATKHDGEIAVCYPWSAMNGLGAWGDAATGVARLDLAMTMAEFFERTKAGGRVDLRSSQR
jgi:hypothetical protein